MSVASRLQRLSASQRERLDTETGDSDDPGYCMRLSTQSRRERPGAETGEVREARLQCLSAYQHDRLDAETSEVREAMQAATS